MANLTRLERANKVNELKAEITALEFELDELVSALDWDAYASEEYGLITNDIASVNEKIDALRYG